MIGTAIISRRPGDRAQVAPVSMPRQGGLRRAFSLIELMVVMAVAVLLTALMMPSMQQLRENAQRVVCMSNMQQLGHSFFIYAGDHNDLLPESTAMNHGASPQDLMIARRGGVIDGWDGLGILFSQHYCDAAECFYCPSHHGKHPYEKYANLWNGPNSVAPIYTNYHYAGHMEWKSDNPRRRSLVDGDTLVLLTDGLRTANDFNHVLGMNSLRGDGSVRWRDDTESIYAILPKNDKDQPTAEYLSLWDLVEKQK